LEVEKWDRANPKSVKGWPNIQWTREAIPAGLDRREWTSEEFERCGAEVLRQYREVLAGLRFKEESRHKVATGWDVERELRFVVHNMRPRTDQFPPGWVGRSIQDRFDDKQRSIIYGLLLDIMNHIPRWRGIDHEKLWRGVCMVPEDQADP
jgi:hypothetical protein